MKRYWVPLVAGLLAKWALGSTDLQAGVAVRGAITICDTAVVANSATNVDRVYYPFTAFLKSTTPPYATYSTTGSQHGDADVAWTDVPPGTYWLSAWSQIRDSGWYYTPPECSFTIMVGELDVNDADPKVRFVGTAPPGPGGP